MTPSRLRDGDARLAAVQQNIAYQRELMPGDIVVMEELSYSPAAVAFADAGARIMTVGLDAQGVDVEAVADLPGAAQFQDLIDLLAAAAERVLVGHVAQRNDAVAVAREIGLVALQLDAPRFAAVAGDYPVVTVRSIFRWLERSGYVREQREWRSGVRQAAMGPA